MAYDVTVYKLYIITGGELSQKRDAIEEVIVNWNKLYSEHKKAMLFPYYNDGTPKFHKEDYDIVLGNFWTRMPEDEDGQLMDQLNAYIKEGHPARFYFSNRDIPRSKLDLGELAKVEEFKKSFSSNGVIKEYNSSDQFLEGLELYLDRTIKDLIELKDMYNSNEGNHEKIIELDEKRKSGFYNFIGSIDDTSKELVGIIEEFINKSSNLTNSLNSAEENTGFGSFSIETGRVFTKFNHEIDELSENYQNTWNEFEEVFISFLTNSETINEECKSDMKSLVGQLGAGLESAKSTLIPSLLKFTDYQGNSIDYNISSKILTNKITIFDKQLEKTLEKIDDLKAKFID